MVPRIPRSSSRRRKPARTAAKSKPAKRAPVRKRAVKAPAKASRTPPRPRRRAGRSHPAPRRGVAAPRPRPAPPPHRQPMTIALFGASGMMGSRIAREAIERGHKVTAIQRNPGSLAFGKRHVDLVQGDATDARAVTRLAKGHDAIASAVSPRGDAPPGHLARVARALLQGARASGVRRLVIVGGAGSLEVASGDRLIDTPQFPDAYKPEALEHVQALDVLRSEGRGVRWTFVSPPSQVAPGERTGRYQAGRDRLLVGKDGQSAISAEDYAVAFVDELEKGANPGRRMTVAAP